MRQFNFKVTATLFFVMAFLGFQSFAQINGDKNIETKSYPYKNIKTFNLKIVAQVEIDATSDADLSITTDANIFEHLSIKNNDGELTINQATWVEASQIKIILGGKALEQLKTDGYSTINVKNLDADKFAVNASVGNVTLSGKANKLTAKTGTGKIDATALKTNIATVIISSHGTVKVNADELVDGNIAENGKILYVGEPKKINKKVGENGEMLSFEEYKAAPKVETKYIKLKLFNNKGKRIHTYVQGPQNRRFSYGMPFNPLQKRAENYPVGTQIYQVNKLGAKTKLLYTVKEEDADKTVKLFE